MVMRVMVIDDDFDSCSLFQSVLGLYGVEVVSIGDGISALSYLQNMRGAEERPDVIILDIMLGDLDGASLLQDVRALVACPVVAITAYYDEVGTLDRVRRARFDGFMEKPVEAARVMGYLEQVVVEGEAKLAG